MARHGQVVMWTTDPTTPYLTTERTIFPRNRLISFMVVESLARRFDVAPLAACGGGSCWPLWVPLVFLDE